VPPFNNLKARQAFSYAVNRTRMTQGLVPAPVSCQVIPPGLLGYRRYCPYTINPNPDGKYTGPNLAKARQLVAASGTQGDPVSIWTPYNPALDPTTRVIKARALYLVSVLQSLGYKARLKIVKLKVGNELYVALADPRRKVQAAVGVGWSLDYAAPSDFFNPVFTCASFQPHSTNNANWAEFCNHKIDREIAHATALQTSNPPAAGALWTKIDHEIVDQAPWIVTANHETYDFVSHRVGNYIYNPQWFALFDQMSVR
jgi:peptide/nickel transport system substrate-binding protein